MLREEEVQQRDARPKGQMLSKCYSIAGYAMVAVMLLAAAEECEDDEGGEDPVVEDPAPVQNPAPVQEPTVTTPAPTVSTPAPGESTVSGPSNQPDECGWACEEINSGAASWATAASSVLARA